MRLVPASAGARPVERGASVRFAHRISYSTGDSIRITPIVHYRSHVQEIAVTDNQIIELVKALGPTVTASGSAIWIVWSYLNNQKIARKEHLAQAEKERIARIFEARKPFSEKQLALYSEVAA
jgi:hypothetical protein